MKTQTNSDKRRFQLACLVLLVPIFNGIAEPKVIDLGMPPGEEGATVARVFETGHYWYDISAGCGFAHQSSDGWENDLIPQSAAATGDFDGDGFDDFAIPGYSLVEDPPGEPNGPFWNNRLATLKRRAAWVVFGSDDTGAYPHYLHRDALSVNQTQISFTGPFFTPEDLLARPYYLFNISQVTAADMNDDGFDDLVIMGVGTRPIVDNESPLGCRIVANILIVYGGTDFRGSFIDLLNAQDLSNISIIEYPLKHEPLPYMDYWFADPWFPDPGSLAVEDVDADGKFDLVIGKSWDHHPTDQIIVNEYPNRGAITVLFGGTWTKGQVTTLDDPQYDDRRSVIWGDEIYSRLGLFTTIADFNGDGIDDIAALNLTDEPGQGGDTYGSVAILYGGTTLKNKNGFMSQLNFDLQPTYLQRFTAATTNMVSIYIRSMTSGDVNNDGIKDILIGVFRNSSPIDHGTVTTVFGATDLPGQSKYFTDAPGTHGEIRMYGTSYNIESPEGDEPIPCADELGISSAVADISGDGAHDWILWGRQRPSVSLNRSPYFQLGRSYALFGGASVTPGVELDLFQTSDVRVESANYPGCGTMIPYYYPSRWYGYPLAGADLNRDGLGEYGNCSLMGRSPDRYALNQYDVWGSFEIIMGESDAQVAATTEYFKAGSAPERGFGGRISPVLRTHLAFADGDGPSPVTATLTRNKTGINGLGVNGVANVQWKLATTRTNWTGASVRLQYTDAEISGLQESGLQLFQAPALSGPWTEVTDQTHDQQRNEFSATVSSFGYLAIADNRDLVAPTVALTSNATDTVSGPIVVQVSISEPVNGFDTGAITTANATVSNVNGSGTEYQFTLNPLNQGVFSAQVAAGSLEDTAGNPNSASNTVSHTLDSIGPVVTLTSTAPSVVGGEIVVSASLSEISEDFTAADVSAENAVVAAFNGSGTSYTFRLIPQSVGEFSARVVAGKCIDALDNPNSASNTIERTYEKTTLRLLTPDGGETFEPAGNVTVTWESTGNVGNKICIELWRRGKLIKVLSKKTANDGTEAITLQAGIEPKKGYLIRIYSVKNHGIADSSNKPFQVVASP